MIILFQLNNEDNLELIIKCDVTGDNPTFFTWYKNGFLIACPNGDLKVKNT